MKYVNLMSSDHLLRSAFASKLAYAKGNLYQPHMRNMMTNLHGSIKDNVQHIWSINKQNNGSACVYGYNSGQRCYVVAFKGSSSLNDVYTFLNDEIKDFHFREYKVGIHRGVLNMFESIEYDLTSLLYPLISPSTPLYITFCGHSLGGCLAMIAASYYSYLSNGNIKVYCHTFGSPKVGDERFYDWLNNGSQANVNICNRGDIVPYLPCKHIYNVNGNQRSFIGETNLNVFENHDLDTYIDNLIASVQMQKICD